MARALKGIVFDLDGVIADTEDFHRRAYNRAFEEIGLSTRWEFADYKARFTCSGGSKLADLPVPVATVEPESFRSELYQAKRRHFVRLLETAPLSPRPGVVRLVRQALDRGVLLGAASTCQKEGAAAILQRCLGPELAGGFGVVKAGEDAPRKKPAPDVYLLALADLGLPSSACVAIEDSRHGLEAAKAAGLWTLVTPSEYTRGDNFDLADRVVPDLEAGGITIDGLEEELAKWSARLAVTR